MGEPAIERRDFTNGFYDRLLKAAKEARENAYAPYSNYKVGCAVVDEKGRIFRGCNVEDIAYKGTHAEATAIASMVTNGGKRIQSLVCVTENGGFSCGDCRQKIWEASGGDKELMLYFVDLSRGEEIELISIGQLLPHAFYFRKN